MDALRGFGGKNGCALRVPTASHLVSTRSSQCSFLALGRTRDIYKRHHDHARSKGYYEVTQENVYERSAANQAGITRAVWWELWPRYLEVKLSAALCRGHSTASRV